MKKTYSVLSSATFLAYAFAAAISGCSSDEASEKVSGGAAGAVPKQPAAAGAGGQGGRGFGGALLPVLGGAPASGQAGSAAVTSIPAFGGAIGSAGAAGALAGMAGAMPNVAGAAGIGIAGGPPKSFDRITVSVANSIIRVVEGTSTPIKVTIHRDGSDYGVVNVGVERPPSATNASPVAVADLVDTAELTFMAQTSADKGGPYPLTIVATSADNPSISAKTQALVYVTGKSGARDVSFGVNGEVTLKVVPQTTETAPPIDTSTDLEVDSKHRVTVGGHSDGAKLTGWVIRTDANGVPDPSLDADGKLLSFGQQWSNVRQLALVNDQLFVAASQQAESSGANHFVRKLTAEGLSDPSFNGGFDLKLDNAVDSMEPYKDGVVIAASRPMVISGNGKLVDTFKPPETLGYVQMVAADRHNKIVYARAAGAEGTFEIGRLLENGALDTANWGTEGVSKVKCWDSAEPDATSVAALLPWSGEIAPGSNTSLSTLALNCGTLGTLGPNPGGAALLVYADDGKPAGLYSVQGPKAVTATGAVYSAIVQSDSKVVVLVSEVPTTGTPVSYQLKRIHKLNANVLMDPTFGKDGVLDLNELMPGAKPERIAYDAAANRLVLVAAGPGNAIKIDRFWL